MKKAIDAIIHKILKIRHEESVLIVFDEPKRKIAEKFYDVIKQYANNTKLVNIPTAKVHGEEPPHYAKDLMQKYDVQFLITSKSLTHTQARINASKKEKRIITMPDVEQGTIERAIDIDYYYTNKITDYIADILDNANEVHITSEKGTDLRFSVKERKTNGRNVGDYSKKGDFGNLPDGEAFIAPVEGTAEGTFIADASMAGIGRLETPLKIGIKKGFAQKIEGKDAHIIDKLVDEKGRLARNIAEFGIGTNPKAIITGNILEDEKVLGTCHIALGNNMGFGGNTDVQLHLDSIMHNPTIYADNIKIMEKGILTKSF
jgi:leucyl aminopeptidase (aminopeptidase T)